MKSLPTLALLLAAFAATPVQAKTLCFVIVGEGMNADPLYLRASELTRSPPLKGSCQNFKTWAELNEYYESHQSTYAESDQIFIAQAVHGSNGGRAFDRVGSVTVAQITANTTPEEAGGTSPQEIVRSLKSMALHHRVGFHDMSCHGGSLLTRYVQETDAKGSLDEAESRLCIATDSNQGMVTIVRDLTTWPELDLSGKSMTEVFSSTVTLKTRNAPVITGLLSAAKMAILPGYSGPPSLWEGGQWPMAIFHARAGRGWTGAYQTCQGELDFGKKPVPIWGTDWEIEQIYRGLDLDDPEAMRDCSVSAHKASVESLELPLETAAQKTRRQACDAFRF